MHGFGHGKHAVVAGCCAAYGFSWGEALQWPLMPVEGACQVRATKFGKNSVVFLVSSTHCGMKWTQKDRPPSCKGLRVCCFSARACPSRVFARVAQSLCPEVIYALDFPEVFKLKRFFRYQEGGHGLHPGPCAFVPATNKSARHLRGQGG